MARDKQETHILKFRGHRGSLDWSEDDCCWHGLLTGLGRHQCWSYEGKDEAQAIIAFRDTVDAYQESLLP